MINKRGQGMPVNVIIIAILALLVLVILAVMVTVRFGIFGQKTSDVEEQAYSAICAQTGGFCRTEGACQSAVEAREGVGAFNKVNDWTGANAAGVRWTDCAAFTGCCVI